MAAQPYKAVAALFLLWSATVLSSTKMAGANWCVARTDASEQSLQLALDYACGSGADCTPIQPNGLCYLPNTVLAHASYAFNSYYQRRGNAPDSCNFAGTATVARTDPSYGSCVYPSSPSSAGGGPPGGSTVAPGTTPTIITPPPPPPGTTAPPNGNGGGLNPGMGPGNPDSPEPNASSDLLKTTPSPFTFLIIFLTLYAAVIYN